MTAPIINIVKNPSTPSILIRQQPAPKTIVHGPVLRKQRQSVKGRAQPLTNGTP